MVAASLLALLPLLGLARAHGSMWHNSMFGFNVTATNSPQYGSRDNRPQAPLKGLPFDQWWFHGHLDQPPHPNDIMELPAGDKVTIELACDKGATSFWPSAPGGNQQNGNDPCPGPPSQLIHTNGIDDLGGCALAIAYKSDANQVRPEDFVVFSINHRCIWDRFTDFQIPANMPECPNGKCTCAWFWHHREDAGGDEMYMNGFQCKITGAKATTPIPKGQVPARCVDDKSKCVKGAKQPFYWDQAEGNNMFEDIYHPPLYLDTYGFADGAQNDIWDTVGGSSGPAQKSSSSSSSSSTSTTAPASTSPAAATTTSAATSTSAQVPDNVATTSTSSAPTTTPAAPQGGANVQDANTVSTSAPTSTTTAAAQQGGGNVQNGTTSSTSAPATRIQGGQGHRTCRPKKTKRSLRRHARRSRVF